MDKQHRYIAFDLGGSGGKMAVGTLKGNRLIVEPIYKFSNHPISINGHLYWSLQNIYESLIEGIKKAGEEYEDIVSIGIDSFCNDFTFVDEEGAILSPIYCYRDKRSSESADFTYSKISAKKLHYLTGNQNADFNTIMQLGALVNEKKGYYFTEGNKLLLLPDLLAYFMTGKKRAEYCNCAVTQMYDAKNAVWIDEILNALGIPIDLFADSIMPGEVLGEIKKDIETEIRIKDLKVVTVCSHDTASAIMALPSNNDDVAFISSGTWSIVGTEIKTAITNQQTFKGNFANEYGYDKRVRLSKNVMGLWILEECRRNMEKTGLKYDYSKLVELALKEKPFRSIIDTNDEPFFAPDDMLQKINQFCIKTRQPEPETPGQYVRCILESLAFRYRYALDQLKEITGKEINFLHILGGGSNNSLLNQFTADACGIVVKAGPADATIYGNLLMQLLAFNRIDSLMTGRDIIAKSSIIKEYRPENTSIWEVQYERFLKYIK